MTATCKCNIPITGSCIGKWALILMYNEPFIGTVIDCDTENRMQPKRIRIQRGPRQGEVVMPGQYALKEFIPDEQVDP